MKRGLNKGKTLTTKLDFARFAHRGLYEDWIPKEVDIGMNMHFKKQMV